MAKSPKETDSRGAKSDADLRAERRAAALRANLHRRKAQSRQRTEAPVESGKKSTPGDS
ncbi:hypothetical protein [Nisaea sediminum]|uniref:hypothetical protein n=1 Tax=Nisaea sediminum TaxID=2775867 RepID=UPI0018664D20|nr:hypothetical protein [Nisaea sediminum]